MNNEICGHGIRPFRVIALVVMSVITFAGIAGAQTTGTTQQASTIKKSFRLWTENNYTVPICWETPGYDREKAIIKRAVTDTWERNSNLTFTWEVCWAGMVFPETLVAYPRMDPTSQLALQARNDRPRVVVRISPQGKKDGKYINAGGDGSAPYGQSALSFPTKLNPQVNLSFAPDGTAPEGRVEYIGVHEFGHVLGFVHEQDSPNHNLAHCSGGTEANSTSLTDYDPDSVMNYCNKDQNMKGNLTAKDIAGLHRIYGVKSDWLAWEESVGGMLLRGKFRTRPELDRMPAADRRNTLITELAGRTKSAVSYYQSLNDTDLAGAGALLVFLRESGSRTDQQIKAMSAEDLRNTAVVEVNVRTNRGINDIQSLSNMNMAKLVLKR